MARDIRMSKSVGYISYTHKTDTSATYLESAVLLRFLFEALNGRPVSRRRGALDIIARDGAGNKDGERDKEGDLA